MVSLTKPPTATLKIISVPVPVARLFKARADLAGLTLGQYLVRLMGQEEE